MPRKATLVILAWTALWLYVAFSPATIDCAGNQGCQAGTAIGVGIVSSFVFGIWFVGFIVLAIAWFMTKPRDNVAVYGPAGQQVMLSESEARKRVAKGWRYEAGGTSEQWAPPAPEAVNMVRVVAVIAVLLVILAVVQQR